MNAIDRQRFRLAHDQARQLATAAIWRAPENWHVEIKPPTRSLDANAKFHALLGDISKSNVPVCGEPHRHIDDLKTIFVSAWMIEKRRPSDVVTGLREEPVQLRRSTTTLSVADMSDLIECTTEWAARHGVTLREIER